MKGVIFGVLESFVVDNFGEEVFEEIYENANLQTKEPFLGPGTYPDEDFLELVGQICKKLGIDVPTAAKKFGEYSFAKLIAIEPKFIAGQTDPLEFLKTVEDIIHVEVRKLYPEAVLPKFEYSDGENGELFLHSHTIGTYFLCDYLKMCL